jgi:hypothetical protein
MTIRLYLDEDTSDADLLEALRIRSVDDRPVQQRYSVGEQMRRLLRLIKTLTAEEMRNRIEFLSAWS